jgi:Fe2+ transport system protein B
MNLKIKKEQLMIDYLIVFFKYMIGFWLLILWFHLLDKTILRKKKPGEKGIFYVNDPSWHYPSNRDTSRD